MDPSEGMDCPFMMWRRGLAETTYNHIFLHCPADSLLGFIPCLSMYLAPFQASACHTSATVSLCNLALAQQLLKLFPVSCTSGTKVYGAEQAENHLSFVHSRTAISTNSVCSCNSLFCRRGQIHGFTDCTGLEGILKGRLLQPP